MAGPAEKAAWHSLTNEDRMFVTPAYAQAAGSAGAGSLIGSMLPLVLIFAIMYFLLIRPQQKKMRDLKAMIEAVRRGDQVLTSGGIIGKVTKVGDDNVVEVEIAEGVKVKIVKSTISQVMSKTEPASA
jgi:preprotein translocase subunit YajC